MSNLFHCILFLWFVSVGYAASGGDDMRTISFGPNERKVIHKHEIQHLIGAGIKFMDITGHEDFDYMPFTSGPSYPKDLRFEKEVKELFDKISSDKLSDIISHLSQKYPTRYYTSDYGVDSAHWVYKNLYDQLIESLSEKRQEMISVEEFQHSEFPQKSVIATIRGSTLENEIIVLGAHEDSVSIDPLLAPGADDDASGVAAVFETFRILAEDEEFVPKRTIQFHSYAAEEAGKLGSMDIASKFKNEKADVYAMINLDMCSYHNSANKTWVGMIMDYTYSELNEFLELVVRKYTEMEYREWECGYACSDHASWDFFGFPSTFPAEAEYNHNIHTTKDSFSEVQMDMVKQYVKLTLGALIELSMAE